MSHDFKEGLPSTAFEALIAAQTRHADEEHFSSEDALQRRLSTMASRGIQSEVLDLFEALDTPSETATQILVETYENAAKSSKMLSQFWNNQGKPELAEQAKKDSEAYKKHAELVHTGEVTAQQELQGRKEQRAAMGFPENDYINLLRNPLFRTK